MKTKINIYIVAAIATIFMLSCSEDELNQQPTTSVSDEQAFSSVEAATTVLNAAYRYIGHYQNHTLSYIAADVMGDDASVTSGAYGYPTYNWNQYSYSYSQVPGSTPWWSGYANYIWPLNYKAIDHCNSIITYANNLSEGSAKNNLVAQAYGVRGYAYHWLVRLFAPAYNASPGAKGVILRVEPATASSDHLPRSTVKETYEQIISDLTYAYENITGTNRDFLTKESVALLLARVYLEMNDFANAKIYAAFAAKNTFDGSNLMSQDEWKSGFKDHNSEWLWFHNFNPATCNIYASIPSFYYYAESFQGYPYGAKVAVEDKKTKAVNVWNGYGTIRFTKAFVDLFEQTDVRKRFPFYFYDEDGYFTSKFNHRTMMGDAEFPMVRIAEAYLIKAEAEAQPSGNAALAKSVLNNLQIKRGATPTESTLENIYRERRKELYGEGHRLFDLKRLRQPLVRSVHPEHWAKVDLPADSPRFMFPIPENEMLYNQALTSEDQNDYWR